MRLPEPEPDCGSPSEDCSGRFPADRLLRDFGFAIRERRRGREPLWARGGQVLPEAQAVRLARAEAEAPRAGR